MEIYIHRNNEEFGPYSREAVIEYLKQGVLAADDYACYAGMSDWKKVTDLLGIHDPSDPTKTSKIEAFGGPGETGQLGMPWAMRRAMMWRKIQRTLGERKSGLIIGLNLVLICLVLIGLYIRISGALSHGRTDGNAQAAPTASAPVILKQPTLRPVELTASATPADEESVIGIEKVPADTPAPVAMKPAPTASGPLIARQSPLAPLAAPKAGAPPIAAAPEDAPAPTPAKPFDPGDIAGNPNAWPKTVKLVQSVSFPAVFNSQVVGSMVLPPGTDVTLVKIQGEQLVLDYRGGQQTIDWRLTDLEIEAAKRHAALLAATPAPALTPAPVPALAATPAATPAAAATPASDNSSDSDSE